MPDSQPRPSLVDAAWDAPAPASPPALSADPVETLRQAESLYETGRLEDAWEAAESARDGFATTDPIAETEALYLLACIAKDRGFSRVGEERIARAIAERADLTDGSVPLSWYELHASLAHQNGETSTALTAWETAVSVARSIREQTGEGTERLCLALRALGDAYLSRGDHVKARQALTELVSEARGLVQAAPDLQSYRHLTSALQRLGDAFHAAHDLSGSLSAYRDAVREAKRAVASSGDAPEALWDLSVGLNRLGGVQLEADQAQAAIASFEQAVETRRTLLSVSGRTPATLTAVASSLSKLGAALEREGEHSAATAAFDEAAALDRESAVQDDHHVMTLVPPPLAR
ncbi:MAG: hypothetical protein IPK82_38785 [Polyangiaceae bacterium]|nr:hypothetical protein [Polyangiaceae bacterium]